MIDERCRELHAAGRTMLGKSQERWLTDGLRAVPDRWNFIAQQTLVARARVIVDGRRRISADAWDDYPDARDRLLDAIAGNGLRSCVVLSGDAHTAYVCDLKRDFHDAQAPVISAEFCSTSITSRGRSQSATDAILRDNPHIHPADRHARVQTDATFVVDAGRPGAQRV